MPHPSGGLSVKLADGIAVVGHLQGKHCHIKDLIAGAALASQF
jgi:hypothetical protein